MSIGLEPIIESLEEKAKQLAHERDPQLAADARVCASVRKFLIALNAPSRESACVEAGDAFAEFRRNFGRDLTMQDVLSYADGLPPGSRLEELIRTSIERLAAK